MKIYFSPRSPHKQPLHQAYINSPKGRGGKECNIKNFYWDWKMFICVLYGKGGGGGGSEDGMNEKIPVGNFYPIHKFRQ